jgi:hypothetical protein
MFTINDTQFEFSNEETLKLREKSKYFERYFSVDWHKSSNEDITIIDPFIQIPIGSFENAINLMLTNNCLVKNLYLQNILVCEFLFEFFICDEALKLLNSWIHKSLLKHKLWTLFIYNVALLKYGFLKKGPTPLTLLNKDVKILLDLGYPIYDVLEQSDDSVILNVHSHDLKYNNCVIWKIKQSIEVFPFCDQYPLESTIFHHVLNLSIYSQLQ